MALNAQSTGWSNVNTETEIDINLIDDSSKAELYLEQMQKVYGKDTLAKMRPNELYKAYRDFSVQHGAVKGEQNQQ